MDPRTDPLLPQWPVASQHVRGAAEFLFEPYWRGERMLAFFSEGDVRLTDEGGEEIDDSFPQAAAELATAIGAEQVVIDGIWIMPPSPGAEDRGAEGRGQPDEGAFVAVDLLELDGRSLLDVPLLERRRLLEAVVTQSRRVRVTPAVRQPMGSWLAAWRQIGFSSYVAKHANSRYLPGQPNPQWLHLSADGAKPPSALGSLIGGQRRREPQISG